VLAVIIQLFSSLDPTGLLSDDLGGSHGALLGSVDNHNISAEMCGRHCAAYVVMTVVILLVPFN